MVKLSFSFFTPAALPNVWAYFSRFDNIAQWDPNVRSSKVLKQTEGAVGSTYDLVTIWKGKESSMVYEMEAYEQNKLIRLRGKNMMITAVDEIQFEGKQGGTVITYCADICLNHIFALATPLIRSDLHKLADEAEQGMKAKCQELFGK